MSLGVPARAAIAFGREEPLRVEEIRVRDPLPGEVRVRVAACSLCASDLHVLRTGEGISFPAVLGHEAAGIVEAVGVGVTRVAEGQRVVLSWLPQCGTCRGCRTGNPHLCSAMKTDGNDGSLLHGTTSLGRYMSVAGLSERVVVGERSAIPIPDGIALGAACAVGCGVTTGFGAAVITGGVRWGESVAVFGCGAVGLSAIQGARTVGASRIIGVDPNRERLDLALKLGATDVLSPEESDPVSAIQVMTDGGVDLAVECVGSADIIRQAFDAISPGGRAVAVGLTSHADHVSIPVVSLLLGKSLHGSIHGSADPVRDFPKLYRLIEGGSLELDSMLGPDYSLDAVNEAMEALSSGRSVRPRVLMGDAG